MWMAEFETTTSDQNCLHGIFDDFSLFDLITLHSWSNPKTDQKLLFTL